jgi:tRNA(fMet)-specific endonuclease VapC
MFLLDTDTATLAFYNHPGVVARVAAATDPVLVPVVTRLEILRGRIEAVLKAASSAELLRAQDGLARTEAFLAGFRLVEIDAAAGEHFDRLRADKKLKGLKKLGRGDLLNACISLANDAMLVTRNTKDFANVPRLKLENWAD